MKRLLLALAFCLVLAAPCQAQLALSSRHTTGSSGGSVTLTIPNVVVSATSPLIVAFYWDNAATVSSANYNTSEALSLIGTDVASSGTNVHTALYGLKNPTTGTHD